MTLLHQNIAGILNKNEIFDLTITDLSAKLGNIDFICLSETFMKKGSECNLLLPGYKIASCFSRQDQRRGGTCILIKNEFDYTPLLHITNQFACPYSFECCGVELKNYNLIIICVYRIPNSNVDIFFEKLSLLLGKVTKSDKKQVIICGDWNIDMLKDNVKSKELKTILHNHNLYPHINVPTRKASSIDQIATNLDNSDVKVDIHRLAVSDHDTGQSISFSVPKINTNAKSTKQWFEKRRDLSQENILKFCDCISSLSFNDVYEEEDCNKSFELFHDELRLFYDLCFPLIRVKVGKKPTKNKWITRGLKKCCMKKRLLYNRYQNEAFNKKHNQMNYLDYTRILKKCILKSQQINNNRYIIQSKNKCKASWDVVKKNINLTNDKYDVKQIKKDDIIYSEPKDICELFNEYFINLTSKNKNIPDTILTYKTEHIIDTKNSMFLKPISESEVISIITSLNNTNSAGYDEISTKIIKMCANFLASPLVHIINKSFEQGVFPNRLKISVVKPIFKKGDPSEMGNYRPITLIPILSKILERAMLERMESFLTKNNILVSNQFGFRKGKSTTQACFSLVKEITESLDKKHIVMGLFLDMSKAFDYVCHPYLLHKLNKYGIRGKANDWLKSYLFERYQLTEISKIIDCKKITTRSSPRINASGVPQGSILGPLLFLMYINDLPKALNHQCFLFADDTTLVIKCKDKNNLETLTNDELRRVIDWLEQNNLKVNLDKTTAVHFKAYNQTDACVNINYQNTNIHKSTSSTFLGMTIDNNLNWKEQVEKVCIKLDKFVFALRRLRLVASQKTALSAYYGYVSSVLRYGLIIWGHSVDAQRALKVQKKCIRAICGADYLDHCKPLFKRLNILPLPSQYILEICMFVKKHPHLFPLHDKVLGKTRSRDACKLYVPSQRLKIFSNNVYCNAIRIFNKLPTRLKAMPVNKFKYTLNRWLLQECFYSIKEFIGMSIDESMFEF